MPAKVFQMMVIELPLDAQIKLLRALEEGEFYPVGGNQLVRSDVRIIASTNRNLETMVDEGTFREDLFYRLNVFSITIPPLRERPEDIIPIAEHFLSHFSRKFQKTFAGFTQDVIQCLQEHPWKGNVRELRNVIERVTLAEDGPRITKEFFHFLTSNGGLRPKIGKNPSSDLETELNRYEKNIIEKTLKSTEGNKAKAARLLKVSTASFHYRLEKHGIG